MHTDQEDDKKIVDAIKEKPPSESIKLIGLYKIYHSIKAAEKKFDDSQCLSSYKSHLAQKALFTSALEVYRCQKGFSKDTTPNLSEFFTQEEIDSPSFSEVQNEVVPTGLFLRVLECHDKEILKHLDNVEVFKNPDNDNFAVEFTFAKNDFFIQEKLRLDVTVDSEDDQMGKIAKVVCTPKIEWLPGKDPCHKEKKIPAKGKKKAKTTVSKVESCFWIFQDIYRPDEDDEEEGEEEDDQDDFSSPKNMYFTVNDALEVLEKDLYLFTIPALFGVKQPQHLHSHDDGDDCCPPQSKGNKLGDAKPECKQQ